MTDMGPPANLALATLLAFAGWTLATLAFTVGVYRWRRILAGRATLAEWYADAGQGDEWYRRATRAHMNCVENLPVYGAIVLTGATLGVPASAAYDALALAFLAARIGQTLVHVCAPATERAAAARFSLFAVQLACMAAMGAIVGGAAVRH